MLKFDSNYSDYTDETDVDYPEGKAVNASSSESYDGTPLLAEFMNDINAAHIAMYEKAYGSRAGISGKADTQKSSQFADAVVKYTDDKVKAHADQRGLANGVHGATSEATPGQIVSRDEYGCAEFAPPLKSSDAARKAEIEELLKALNERILIGEIKAYAGIIDDTHPVPTGWLLCDGSEVSKETFSSLYAVLGESYGIASDASKFKLPDLRGRFLQGADGNLGEYIEAGLPNITGTYVGGNHYTGAFEAGSNAEFNGFQTTGKIDLRVHSFSASKGETKTDGTLKTADETHVYGNSNTVQPPACTINYLIKY